ncbi:COG1361 S-layer family protein [Halococcus sp. IIIV-5B]|uniref:COG1361 S-layer family protein n=1 Tax=Halococcus sp. IIIV-5B TaxID=2321230 RepID=UPI000E7659FB|nr:COG1361 S-layer family protein [Halococcus sp. IIIV-5B]RJT06572.1 hypothetical protein D3261_05805 [Halococcus sp. IIIV-5B]
MKRSVLAVVLVGLVVMQGVVGGAVVGGTNTAPNANDTGNDSALSKLSNATGFATDALDASASNTDNASTETNGSTDTAEPTESTDSSASDGSTGDDTSNSTSATTETTDGTSTAETAGETTGESGSDDGTSAETESGESESSTSSSEAESSDGEDATSSETQSSENEDGGSESGTSSSESESGDSEDATSSETESSESEDGESSSEAESSDGEDATTDGDASASEPTSAESGASEDTGSAEDASAGSSGTASAADGAGSGAAAAGASGGSASPTGGAASEGAASQSAASQGAAGGSSSAAPAAAGGSSQAAPSGASAGGAPQSAGAAAQSPAGSTGAQGQSAQGASAQGAPSAAGGSQAAAGSGASTVSPDAEFDIVSVDSDVSTGEPGTVSVTIENTGEDATDAVVNFQSGSSDLLFGQAASTSRYIGDWEEGESRTVDLSVQAAPGADSADYPVEASVSYEDDDGEAAQSASSTFGVTVDEASDDLSVTGVDSDVPVGGTGNVSVTLENTGEDATDAVVNLQTLSTDLLFDRSANATRYVGDWDAGESRTIEVTMQATPSADTDTYPVQASVSYDDSDGEAAQLGPATFGVTPESQQEFSLDGVSDDLEVGSSGTISGTITNDGPKAATDAVLTVSPNSTRDIVPRQSEYVLGDLDVDESSSFELPVLVNDTTEPGERQVQYYVQYYDSDGDPLRSEALTATVDIDEQEDDFNVVSTSTDVQSGEEGSLTVVMNNTGENVTDATVSFQSLSGGVLFGESANATQFVEDWDTGEERSFEFDVTATGSAGTTYPMQASLQYTDSEDDGAQAGPFAFGVTPGESEDDFEVVSTDSNVQVGDEGPITLTLQNNGENATETTVSLQSLTGDITLGQTANATAFVGEWPAGAQRTVSFNATATNTTDVRDYPFQASVSYNDPDGDSASGGPFTIGVTPEPEQNFDLSNVESTLRVGSEGNVTAQVTNQGPQAIDNAVVELESQSESLSPQETEAAVGSLASGESANVSFPIEVPDSAESGARQLSFAVEYDNENGDTRRSGSLSAQVDVAGQRDSFIVERANASVGIGSSDAVTLNVTNNRDTVVTNLNAKAYADSPLSLSNDEAYIARLAPGETEQISFDVSVAGSASEGQYPLSVDFQYDTPSESSQLSQEYNVPVDAAESSGGGLLSSAPVMIGLAALLVVLGIGVVWSRR